MKKAILLLPFVIGMTSLANDAMQSGIEKMGNELDARTKAYHEALKLHKEANPADIQPLSFFDVDGMLDEIELGLSEIRVEQNSVDEDYHKTGCNSNESPSCKALSQSYERFKNVSEELYEEFNKSRTKIINNTIDQL